MVKPKHIEKQPDLDVTDIVEEIQSIEPEVIIENTIKETGANEIEIPKFEGPIEPAIIDIIPGKKVKVEGREEIFVISQKLNDGKVSILGPEGLILKVKPGELKNIK